MTDWSTTNPTESSVGAEATFADEGRLLRSIREYLRPQDVKHVKRVLTYVHELRFAQRRARRAHGQPARSQRSARAALVEKTEVPASPWDLEYVISVAYTLADAVHIDAISLAAVLLYQAVESDLASLDEVRARLGGEFGEAIAQTIQNIERFDTLQRPGTVLRRSALIGGEGEETSRERRRSRERQRQQDTENLRKMFLAMVEDPRVAIFKIADQLRLMRLIRRAADYWRAQAGEPTSSSLPEAENRSLRVVSDKLGAGGPVPAWTEEECRVHAEETRELYAPLAGRLGMGRVEGELEDLAFAVLEPDEYRWLSDAVKAEEHERSRYVDRVCEILRDEMHSIGLDAEVSGRAKHLYSIYRKVQRTGSRDLSQLYDILAFRIIVESVADCYLALGHVHALWRPKDGRIKDFIANPKANGYQSLHTTVFCLDNRLAEIQIRTREMHQLAEYGVAMHWYYKDVGDAAASKAKSLQSWVQQVQEWQQEFQVPDRAAAGRAVEAVKGDVLRDQIFVFTPAGDVKDLPAGSTPLDFAYRIHTDVGNQVAGVRVTSESANGRLVKKLVPLDYELKNGDVVEVIKRKDAHPTRDWLNVARTKLARDRIQRYLKAHERDIDLQMGRDRLDRELRSLGFRKGYEELSEEDVSWLVETFEQPDEESLLVGVGGDKLRASVVAAKLRERLRPQAAVEAETAAPPAPPSREAQVGASVAGVEGMLTRLATCCNPLPGDQLMGFISRGRGVVIHRTDCPNLKHLLERQPERGIVVDWPKLDGMRMFRAPIIIEATDRTGLLADVTGLITGMKINMTKVSTVTKSQHRAIITATLEIQRPEQLNTVINELRQVPSVLTVERKKGSVEKVEGARRS